MYILTILYIIEIIIDIIGHEWMLLVSSIPQLVMFITKIEILNSTHCIYSQCILTIPMYIIVYICPNTHIHTHSYIHAYIHVHNTYIHKTIHTFMVHTFTIYRLTHTHI